LLNKVILLFVDHANLLREFIQFLPNDVQAKAQLDLVVKKAKDRARKLQ
jgi:hypothetical protein